MKIYTEADVKNVQVGKFTPSSCGYIIDNTVYDKPIMVTFNDGKRVNSSSLMSAIDDINNPEGLSMYVNGART